MNTQSKLKDVSQKEVEEYFDLVPRYPLGNFLLALQRYLVTLDEDYAGYLPDVLRSKTRLLREQVEYYIKDFDL